MSNVQKFQGIPIILSGEKYLTSEGFFAIKNGVKRKKNIHKQKRDKMIIRFFNCSSFINVLLYTIGLKQKVELL